MPEKEHWLSLAIIGFVITSAISFLAVSPVLLGGMVEQLGFSKQLIGWVTAVNSLGVAIAGITVSIVVSRFGILNLTRLGLAVLIFSEIGAAFSTQAVWMLSFRFLAGLFGGLAYVSALSAFASLSQPIRGFSTYTIVFCSFSSVTLFLLPIILQTFSLRGGFLLLAFFAALGLLGSSVLKNFNKRKPKQKLNAQVLKLLAKRTIFLTVLAYFALQAGSVSIWAFLERIGDEKGLSPTFIGFGLSLTGLCGIIGAITTNALRKKLSLLGLMGIGFPALGISLALFYFGTSSSSYIMAIVLFATAWAFILPIYQSIQAAYDPEGKIVSIGAFMNMLGQSTGPALASLLLGNSPYINAVWIAFGMLLLSWVSIIPSIWGLKSR